MKRFFFLIGDNILKWFLFIWRFLFWFVIGIIFFMFMMNALPRAFSWAFSYILLSILFYKYIYKVNEFMKDSQQDLQIIRKKLGLVTRPVTRRDWLLEEEGFLRRRIHGGINFLLLRKAFIGEFGFKRWLEEGRRLAGRFYREYNKDRRGDPELWERTSRELK